MEIHQEITDDELAALPSGEWRDIASRDFNGDIVITDPCYLDHGRDIFSRGRLRWWDESNAIVRDGGGMQNRTFYGDWGCTVFSADGEKVGKRFTSRDKTLAYFAADSGEVCVVPLASVAKVNPNFEAWAKERDDLVAIIRGFKGKVRLCVYKGQSWPVRLRVHGDGEKEGQPFHFETCQTSL